MNRDRLCRLAIFSIHARLRACDASISRTTLPRPVSIHARLRACDDVVAEPAGDVGVSIHARLRACDAGCGIGGVDDLVSIHARLRACDTPIVSQNCPLGVFQSTHAYERATGRCGTRWGLWCCFNPRTPTSVRHDALLSARIKLVSIHARLRACDRLPRRLANTCTSFNPRTPTSVRRRCSVRPSMASTCFNPRTPTSVRPDGLPPPTRARSVSIHARLRACDGRSLAYSVHLPEFQSTHAYERATWPGRVERFHPMMFQSTHAYERATR